MNKKRKRPTRLRSYRWSSLYAPLALCVLLAFVAAVIVRPAASESKSEEPITRFVNDDDIVVVQVPSRPIVRGEKLSSVPFAAIKWPKSRLSSEYIGTIDAYKDAVAITPLPKLLPIPVSAVTTAPLDANHVSSAIPPGMRGITVRVDAESAVEGWAQSGNYVDVYLVRATKDGALETRVIAENIKILSAERSALPAASDQIAPKAPSTVTLLVAQEDALKIKTATNLGKLTFALRGTSDPLPVTKLGLNQRELLDGSTPVTPAKKKYRGVARGVDGRTFVLEDNADWAESADEQTRISPRAQMSRRIDTPDTAQPTH